MEREKAKPEASAPVAKAKPEASAPVVPKIETAAEVCARHNAELAKALAALRDKQNR